MIVVGVLWFLFKTRNYYCEKETKRQWLAGWYGLANTTSGGNTQGVSALIATSVTPNK